MLDYKNIKKIDLKDVSKEELIRVVAEMHDTILTWDCGWGLPDEIAETLIVVGGACCEQAFKNGLAVLPLPKLI